METSHEADGRSWDRHRRVRMKSCTGDQGVAPAVLCLLVVALAAACGGSGGTALPTYSPSGVSHGSLVVAGHERTYRLFRPPSLDPKRAAPLVFALHGFSF